MVEEEMDSEDRTEPVDAEDSDELSEFAMSIESEAALEAGKPVEATDGARAFKIAHPAGRSKWPRRLRKSREHRGESVDSGIRLKALPLLGAILGLASFALPWDTLPAFTFNRVSFHRLGDYVIMFPSDYVYALAIAAALVLVGSILLFLTSFGGIVQMSGIGLFILGMPGDISRLEIGFVVCLVGAVLGCSSLVVKAPLAVPRRFLTLSYGQSKGGGFQVSLVSLFCFVVGAVSFSLPWVIQRYGWRFSDFYYRNDYEMFSTLISYVFDQNQDMLLVTGASLFVIGTILAILTPLAGVVQGVGVVAFFVGIQPHLMEASDTYGGFDVAHLLGPGIFVGIIAAALGVIGLFFPFRVRLPMRTLALSEPEPLKQRARGRLSILPFALKSTMPRLLPAAVALMIVLSSTVAVASLAYTQKWSSVVTVVAIYIPQEDEVEMTIFVDGSEIFADIASSYSHVIVKSQVRAGTHKISIDYCFLSVDPDGVDGVTDYSTYCQVRPFSQTRVHVEIGTYYTNIRGIGLETSPVENGTEVVFGSFDWDGLWSPSVGWSDVTLMLTDGTSYVYWAPGRDDLRGGIVTEMTYEARTLGETNISCTIIDFYGNGYVDPGDMVTLSAADDTSFSPDIIYTLFVMYDRENSLIGECELVIG